jgi:hypothetical protein
VSVERDRYCAKPDALELPVAEGTLGRLDLVSGAAVPRYRGTTRLRELPYDDPLDRGTDAGERYDGDRYVRVV